MGWWSKNRQAVQNDIESVKINEVKASEAYHTVVNFICIRYPFQATPNSSIPPFSCKIITLASNARKFEK